MKECMCGDRCSVGGDYRALSCGNPRQMMVGGHIKRCTVALTVHVPLAVHVALAVQAQGSCFFIGQYRHKDPASSLPYLPHPRCPLSGRALFHTALYPPPPPLSVFSIHSH